MTKNVFFAVILACLNPLKIHPGTKLDKNMINDLDYEEIKFPLSKKDYCRIKGQNNICTNVLCYENNLTSPAYVTNQKFENCMNLLLTTNENKSHYVYITDFNRFMYNKTKNKINNIFANVVYNFLVSKKF